MQTKCKKWPLFVLHARKNISHKKERKFHDGGSKMKVRTILKNGVIFAVVGAMAIPMGISASAADDVTIEFQQWWGD